jgi:hypothetical protein
MDELDELRSETSFAIYRVMDGLMSIELKPDLIIDIDLAKRIEHHRLRLVGGHSWPTILVMPPTYLLLDKEAFSFFGSDTGVEGCAAKAVVIKSTLRKLLMNFSLIFNNQSIPFRLFNHKSDAKLWLFSFIQDRYRESENQN